MRGKVVAITGASQGIGAATAKIFAQAGAQVMVLARNKAKLDDLAAEIGNGALGMACDVADFDAVQATFAQIRNATGRLDVLIGNAGLIEPVARIADTDPGLWARNMDVNLNGVFHGMRAAIPIMRAQGGGTILTISSGAAHTPKATLGAYCVAKAGAAMLTRMAHLEEAANGLRIMGLSPGKVATDMQLKLLQSELGPDATFDPVQHVPPDWPAKALLWMCSADADTWLGQEISLRDDALRRKLGLK